MSETITVDPDAGLQGSVNPPSWEELGHKMYSKEHVRFHTEIVNPDAMSFLDMTASFTRKYISEAAGDVMNGYLSDYRDNMVAYKRQRAKETESMVKANVEGERNRASVREMLLGLQR
jgi:hypothetical protein